MVLQAIESVYGDPMNLEPERKKVIAELVGIDPKTLTRWIKMYGWDWDELIARGARGHRN